MKPSRDQSSSIGEISDDDPQINDVSGTYKSDKILPKQESLLIDKKYLMHMSSLDNNHVSQI